MRGKATYRDQRFFSEKWGKGLFKHPEVEKGEKRPEEEKASCIRWFKTFMKEEWLPADLSDQLCFIRDGVTTRDWNKKKNASENGFVIRYAVTPYLFQLEHTRTKVLVGVKKINGGIRPITKVEGEKRIYYVIEVAKDIFLEGVVQIAGKELKNPHIYEKEANLVWGWWSPAETRPIYDDRGKLVGYDLSGESPNQVLSVDFQTNGETIRYEIGKRLSPLEDVSGVKESPPDDYRINDQVITEDKDATYIAYPEEERFFDTLWGGELFSFSGEEVMRQYPQPPTHEKQEMVGQIKQIVKEIYVPPDTHKHLFYVPKGVREVDLSSNTFREKDGFMVRYLIGSYIIQIEKTNSALFVGVKPIEIKDYLDEMTDRIDMVRKVSEEVLKEGLVPKEWNASFFSIKIHNEDLTYGWFRSQDEPPTKIEFLTDGYGLRLEIRNPCQFVI